VNDDHVETTLGTRGQIEHSLELFLIQRNAGAAWPGDCQLPVLAEGGHNDDDHA
jgi:hypothetical protein